MALLAAPLVLAVVFLFLIFVFPKVPSGIDLVGGTVIRISLEGEVSTQSLADTLSKQFNLTDVQVNTTKGPLGSKLLIQFSFNKDLKLAKDLLEQAKQQSLSNPQNAISLALQSAAASAAFYSSQPPKDPNVQTAILFAEESFNKAKENFAAQLDDFFVASLGLGENPKISRDEIGAVFGETFYSSALTVSVIGIVLVVLVVLFFFRELVPSIAIFAAIFFDVGGALALMAIFQIPMSLATIPALLMLIGYSVDTDIMLSSRLLKRKEKNYFEVAHEAMTTGLTMTLTTLAALTVMLVLSYFAQITVIFQIAAVLVFGLASDLVSTWFMNAPILLWYLKSKKGVVF